jgi:hypothetical protein
MNYLFCPIYAQLGLTWTNVPPTKEELSRLLHDLREPIGAFVIYLALLDDEELSSDGRKHLEAMLRNVERMVASIDVVASTFGLERSTPLALVSQHERAHDGNATPPHRPRRSHAHPARQ